MCKERREVMSRERKYDFTGFFSLRVGQSTELGSTYLRGINVASFRASLHAAAVKAGAKFHVIEIPSGLWVEREA